MPDTPETPKRKPPSAGRGNPEGLSKQQLHARFARSTVDREMAMMMFLRMKRPMIRALHQELKEMGHTITEGTLSRWKREHHWTTHMDTHRKVQESEILGLLKIMNFEGQNLGEAAVKGALARTFAMLGKAISKVECKTPKDVNDLLDACEKMRAMSHTVRGDQFSEVRKTGEAVTGGPQVTLGKFTPKLAANNGKVPSNGNGEAHE
jgi:hypothetical protein